MEVCLNYDFVTTTSSRVGISGHMKQRVENQRPVLLMPLMSAYEICVDSVGEEKSSVGISVST